MVNSILFFILGYFYYETRRAVNALEHQEKSFEIYQALCSPRKVNSQLNTTNKQFIQLLSDVNKNVPFSCLSGQLSSTLSFSLLHRLFLYHDIIFFFHWKKIRKI